jgi:hypothetical protein
MRTTRALIAGLGTTGSLIAAAAGVFLVASAVIAFKGWPGTGFTDRIDNLFVTDEPPVAWDRPGTQAVAAGAGTAAAAVAPAAAGPTFGTPGAILSGGGSTLRGVRSVTTGTTTLPPSGGGDGSGGDTGGPGDGQPLPNPSQTQNTLAGTVQQTGSGLSGTVRNTTDTVGNTVGGPVGDAVKQTGNNVGNTVDNTTQTVGGLLKPKQ